MAKLTKNQKLFCDEYLIDRNATRAYLAAYSNVKNENTAAASSSRLLRNVKIQEYINSRLEVMAKKLEVTAEKVIKEYAKLAFFNPKRLFHENGSPKNIEELDDNTAAAIAGLEVLEVYEGYGDDKEFVGYTRKYKLADKKSTLDSLARHLGLFNDSLEIKDKTESTKKLNSILEQLKR